MKIAYIVLSSGISINDTGGAGNHIRGTLAGFKKNGVEVKTYIHGDLQKRVFDDVSIETNKAFILKSIIPDKLRKILRDINIFLNERKYLKSIKNEVREFQPDLIYERSCYLASANKLAKDLRIKHFLETSGVLNEIMYDDFGGIVPELTNRFERIKYERADIIVTEADSAIDFIRKKFNLSEKVNIISKPLGVDLDKFKLLNEEEVGDLKSKYNINSRKVIGYIGTFASYHRVELLLPVFDYFKNRSDISFVLIGEGGNYSEIKEYVLTNQINNVLMLGRLSKRSTMNISQIFDVGIVTDSVEHMYPMKTIEYGLLNICPIVPDYFAFRSILDESKGYFFNPKSPDSIVNTIEIIIDEMLYEDKGINWGEFVRNNYGWQHVVKNIFYSIEYESITGT